MYLYRYNDKSLFSKMTQQEAKPTVDDYNSAEEGDVELVRFHLGMFQMYDPIDDAWVDVTMVE